MKNDLLIQILSRTIESLEKQNMALLDVISNLTHTNPGLKPNEKIEPPKFVDMLGAIESIEAVSEQDKIDKKIALEQINGILNH